MARHVFLAFTSPVEGREDDYNHWQDNVHLPDGLSIPGYVSARRFKLADAQFQPDLDGRRTPYVTIWEIESDDIAKTLQDTFTRSSEFEQTDAIDGPGIFTAIYSQEGDIRIPKK